MGLATPLAHGLIFVSNLCDIVIDSVLVGLVSLIDTVLSLRHVGTYPRLQPWRLTGSGQSLLFIDGLHEYMFKHNRFTAQTPDCSPGDGEP